MTSDIDTTQFNDSPREARLSSERSDTPVIRKLAETTEKKSRKRNKSTEGSTSPGTSQRLAGSRRDPCKASKEVSTRGRKRKYTTDEERLEARRIQQRQYRERKRAELAALKQNKVDSTHVDSPHEE